MEVEDTDRAIDVDNNSAAMVFRVKSGSTSMENALHIKWNDQGEIIFFYNWYGQSPPLDPHWIGQQCPALYVFAAAAKTKVRANVEPVEKVLKQIFGRDAEKMTSQNASQSTIFRLGRVN